MPGAKEAGPGKDVVEEEALEERENAEATQSKTSRTTRKGEMPIPGE
jgi:guanylate kinase